VIDPQGNALSLSYDSQLRLTALTDATGRQTTFAHGRSNSPLLITAITDPFGRTASLVYNDSGHLFSITDVLGLTSNFAYDSSGLVNSMTTPYGTTQFAYGQNPANLYRWLQITDPLGLNEREETLQPTSVAGSDASVPSGFPLYNAYLNYRDSFHWDKHAYTIAGCTASGGCNYNDARARHFLHDSSNVNIESSVTEALQYPLESRIWFGYPGQSQPYFSGTYDQPSGIARLLDNGGTQLKQFAYNGFGRTTQAVDPVGRTTNFTYAANLIDLTKVTQNTASGAATIAQFTWNSQHRPLTYTDAAGQVWQYAYNAARQPVSATNPLSQTTTYQYNTLGYLTGIFQGRTTLASLTRDAFGRVATYTDAGGWTVSYNYDAADRVTKITYPDGTFDQYTWNKLDLAEFQDRQSNSWNYGHDADRRLTSVADPLNNQTQFGYWENGRLRSLLDPKGNLTVWDIDVEGRPTIKQYADSTTVSYAYENTTSRLKSVIDALGQTKQYAYAADDRVSGISYLNPVNPTPNVGFGWDSYFPRLTAMTDGTGTTQYSYMAPGTLGALLLQQETGAPPAGAIAYAYDALGRVASRSIGGIVQETFQYDTLSRLVTYADGLGQFALSYLGETGQIAQRQASISAGTWATSWSYLENTGDRRLASVHSSGLGPVVGQHSYTTTAEDFASAVAESCSPTPCGSGWTYSYDAADRLTSGYPIGAASAYAYTLDPAGNISLFQSPYAPSEQATYSNVNALTNFAGQAFSYDANGNLTSDGQRSYAWDAENRLVAIGYAAQPGKQTSFAYDGLGRRSAITTTVSGTASTTYYLWCGSQLCQAVNPSGTVARSYFAEGEAVVVPPPATAALYYGPDRLGSVRDVAAVSGATVAQQVYTYDPYGNPLQRPEGSVLTDRRFAGMFYHADSGLYLTRTRAYNPATGRWLSRDPLGEGTDPAANLYRYVVNNPTNLTDPLGLGWTITFGGPPPAGDPFPNNPNPLPPRPGDPNVPCPTVLRGGGGDPGGGADPGGGDPGLVPVADPGPPPLTDPGSAPGIPDAGNPWVLAGPPTPDASATPAPFQPAAFTPSPKQPPCSGPNSDCAKTPGFGRGMGALLDPLNPGKFLCPDCFGKTYGPPTDEDWDR
jgi:RHS repeat-associated protein